MSKKTFTIAIIISSFLISLVTGMHTFEAVKANPYVASDYVYSPFISVDSPLNNKTFSNETILSFTVTKPSDLQWLIERNFSGPILSNYLNTVGIVIDGDLFKLIQVYSNLSSPYTYSDKLPYLDDGKHTLAVEANCEGWIVYGYGVLTNKVTYTSFSDTINFTIDTTLPKISLLSPENKTYYMSEVAVDFTVSERCSQISYSLDGHDNIITDLGRHTLNPLSDGAHNLTVYATDEAGNVGSSDTVFFTLNTQPSLSPSPSPSIPEFPSWTILAALMIVMMLVAAAAKRKRVH